MEYKESDVKIGQNAKILIVIFSIHQEQFFKFSVHFSQIALVEIAVFLSIQM